MAVLAGRHLVVLPGVESGSSVEAGTNCGLPRRVGRLEQVAVDFGGHGLLEKVDRDDQTGGAPLSNHGSGRSGEWTAGDSDSMARSEVGMWDQRRPGKLKPPEALELFLQSEGIVDR